MAADTTSTITSFLEKILDNVHPLMAEALCMAAIPGWYNSALLGAMRQREDGREEGLMSRLARYSFIVPMSEAGAEDTNYLVRPDERIFLQRYWIAKDRQAYLLAQQRALAYWTANPDPNEFAQAENLLYHQLFVDIQAGMDYLVDRFRAYYSERQLAAIERLLDTAAAARYFLVMLENESLDQLDDLVIHLRARLAQLRGEWDESLEALGALRNKGTLAPWLRPYIVRAYGKALAHTGQYAEAIEQYSEALDLFNQSAATLADSAGLQSERAHTMIDMGDAHVDLAISVRGYQERIRPETGQWRWIRGFFYFFLSLPLVFYLSFHLGRRVWHPRFWHLLNNLDWIVARLFATGARLYNRADPILEMHGTPVEGIAADEQLAYLYLSMGDMEQAELIFSKLLTEEEAPLGEYRQASIRLGLGQALLGLGQCQSAGEQLEMAQPVLALYEDRSGQAEADRFLGEAKLEIGQPLEAIAHMRGALHYYQAQDNETLVTELAEQLTQLSLDEALEESQKALAANAARQVVQRRYPVRYRHPATIFFQRAAFGLLAIAIFLILVSSIRIGTGVEIAPAITFQASPLLQHDNPDFTPNLSQGVAALDLATITEPDVLLWLAILLFAIYLSISTSIGIIAIRSTSLARVQSTAEAETVRFDGRRLRLGSEDASWAIDLVEVSNLVKADMRFVNHMLVDDSATTLFAPRQRLAISGRTAWYPSLCRQIASQLPETTSRVNISFSMIRSRLGTWYLATIGALLILALLAQASSPMLIADLPGIFYSLADLHPFLYIGLVVPPIYWFIVWPLRMRLRNDPTSRLPWWVGGVALLLVGLRMLTRFTPWLTIPDIYIPLLILLLLASAAIAIWRTRLPDTLEPFYANWIRLATAGPALAISLIILFELGRGLGAYHFLVQGNHWRDQSLQQESQAEVAARQAVEAYDQVLQISGTRLLNTDRLSAPDFPVVIPQPRDFIWVNALINRAAMYSQLGEFEAAVQDYTRLLTMLDDPADIYADRAMAYLRLAATNGEEGEVNPFYQNAIADFDQAVEKDLANARYRLWRGVARHAQGDLSEALSDYRTAIGISGGRSLDSRGLAKARTGLGWIAFVRDEYDLAVESFQAAQDANPDSAEAGLGLGYAHYLLRQYDEALQAWGEAADHDPTDPAIFISLGTLYWRVGTLGSDYNASGTDRCDIDSLSEEEKRQSAAQLEQAIENFSLAVAIPGQNPEDVAFTYRTMAQVEFLLRYCPGYDATEVLRKALDYYSEAIKLDPDNAVYWQMRGRLSYSLWFNSPAGSGPAAREILFTGLADLNKALEIDPDEDNAADYRPAHYRRILLAEAINGTLAQGDRRFDAGEFELASAYYELVAENQPEDARPAFKRGLASLAMGDQEGARVWYREGLERAMATVDESAVQIAWLEYQALESRQGVEDDSISALFEDYGLELGQTEDAATAFSLALVAMRTGALRQQAADLYELGITLASAAEDINLVKSAAAALRDFTLDRPDLDEANIYWPLWQDQGERELAAAELDRPDLYWRYRAEFGFRYVIDLFKQRPGNEATYEAIYAIIMEDIERAYQLNASGSNQTWRDFFVDANIGWLYLRRGDEQFADAAYEAALADYVEATDRIQPQSANAINDLTDATFRAGLASLALGREEQAQTWYGEGLNLFEQYQAGEAILDKAISDLDGLLEQDSELESIGEAILRELNEAR